MRRQHVATGVSLCHYPSIQVAWCESSRSCVPEGLPIIAQRFIAGYGGPTIVPFSPVGTAGFPTPRFSRPSGTNDETLFSQH